jgi:hypothetical protein
MGLFEKKSEPEPVVTGIDILRKTVKARNKSPHSLTLLAREIEGVGAGQLEAFAEGKADLSVEALQKVAKLLYQSAEYDVASGMLISVKAPTRSLCAAYPPTYQPPPDAYDLVAVAKRPLLTLPPASPPKKLSRPGWLVLTAGV